MSLHGPAGACIPIASASPIDVPPIQCVLKHCGVYIHYIYTHVTQNNLRTPQLAGFARQLGCKKQNLCVAFCLNNHLVSYVKSTDYILTLKKMDPAQMRHINR